MNFVRIFTCLILAQFSSAQSPSDYPTTRVPGNCGNITQFDCGNGVCIPFTSVRNCLRDCPNGADEECGTNQVLCDISIGSGCGKCVAIADAPQLCLDRRYERICERGLSGTTNSPIFKCSGTTNCVPMDWLNDGTNDCGDFSDEDPCMNGYNCTQVDVSGTIPLSFCTCKNPFRGNGTVWTINDPMFRQRIPGNCINDPLQFDCGGSCIDINLVRDCKRDCPNGADEACWGGSSSCSDNCTCRPSSMLSQCPEVTSTTRITSVITTLISSTTTQPTTTTFLSTSTASTTAATTTAAATTTTVGTTTTTAATTTSIPSTSTLTTRQTTITLSTTVTTTNAATQATNTSVAISSSTTRNSADTTVSSITSVINGSATTTLAGTTIASSSIATSRIISTTASANTATPPRAGSCPFSQFPCSNGQCISDLLVLDGKTDCADGSDERCLATCTSSQTCYYQPLYHNFTCVCPSGSTATVDKFCLPSSANQPRDCADLAILALQNAFNFTSGVYIVYKANCQANDRSCLVPCTCDMDTDGGGYTVVQHRQNTSVDFNRNWDEYKNGFNLGQTDFWQGNEYLSSLTNRVGSSGLYEAIVQVALTNGTTMIYKYNRILVGKESESYQLTLGTLIAGDVDNLMISRNRNFATLNRDFNAVTIPACASYWQSGWWFDTMCRDVGNLNVPFVKNSKYPYLKGIDWPGSQQQVRNVSSTSFLIRPTWYPSSRQQLVSTTITPRTGQNRAAQLFTINKCLLFVGFMIVLHLFIFV